MVNAQITLGLTYSITTPPSRQMQEKVSPFAGTARLDSLANALGATPSCARPKSIRLVENTPLFAEEAADVSTTKLIRLAAAGRPTRTNSSTNGLLVGTTEPHGVTDIITISAKT
ncbi:hypothetical protein D3C76_1357620 [compost metagenome]